MSWNEDISRRRIERLLATVPESGIRVEDFATTYRQRRKFEARLGLAKKSTASIDDIPYSAVVVADGVHVYANLLEYDAFLEEIGRESEPGSAKLLEFVHLHYSGLDRLIEAFGAQRVDHHGGRVHAVVLEPAGAEFESQRIHLALSLAAAMRELVGEASAAQQQRYGSRLRVGVESGVALAINSGRKGEPEPLFIGDAANVAAKLADGNEEGVAIGPRARAILSTDRDTQIASSGLLLNEANYRPGTGQRAQFGALGGRLAVDAAFDAFRKFDLKEAATPARFAFFRHSLPLAEIEFAALSPSRTARQEVVSLFADLSGFTAYVHRCLASGDVRQVVSNLHVLRGEMAAVLRDFGGRKIRFIGDCIHGVLAEGSQMATNDMDSVRQAIRCAGALRSSFELCQTLLPGLADMGLAIGIELGATPVTRLGIRGTRSVRCASSKAVTVSERVQRDCEHDETALGANALAKAPATIRKAFGAEGVIGGLDYFAALAFAAAISAPAIARPSETAAEPHAT